MSLWTKIKNFLFPPKPQPTYMEQLKDIIEQEEAKKPKAKPRAKKVKDENLP